MRVVLIRHYKTPGNLLGRYIGITDEDLVELPTNELRTYPAVERIYASPMKRCIQTAKRIYPGQYLTLCVNLRECNFGRFENKNYLELAEDPMYQAWIDSNGTMAFPEGEDPLEFRKRCVDAFEDCIQEAMRDGVNQIAMVVHGGTIMSIMAEYDDKHCGYYDYQVKNGDGYVVTVSTDVITHKIESLHCEMELLYSKE